MKSESSHFCSRCHGAPFKLSASAVLILFCHSLDAFSPSVGLISRPVTRSPPTHSHDVGGTTPAFGAGGQRSGTDRFTLSASPATFNAPTELPDSLQDAARIAAEACQNLAEASGPLMRCRVDFDTSVGDETYTTLKSSTEFMQEFVTALSYASIPGMMQQKQDEMMRASKARAELRQLLEEGSRETIAGNEEEEEGVGMDRNDEGGIDKRKREEELRQIIAYDGADSGGAGWTGPKVRIYFPDEGSAALARRDWKSKVPTCLEYSACGGVQLADVSKDAIVIFCCPRASESESVEKILYEMEASRGDELLMSVMVNPLLVDMGVTGFGMAGRRLRERLIDGLTPAYYLRTLPWGAMTRVWPSLFTVWQEDADADGGYRMIKALDALPSNPEVEDIYDIENGDMQERGEGMGLLNGLADFVNGMMSL